MAVEAYRQAWETLLEKRAEERKSPGGAPRSTTQGRNDILRVERSIHDVDIGGGGREDKDETIESVDANDEIGMILLQAKVELTRCSTGGPAESGCVTSFMAMTGCTTRAPPSMRNATGAPPFAARTVATDPNAP